MRIVHPSVTLEWITPEPLLSIERAGRVCYKSEDKITPGSAEKFCTMINQRGHASVVEHAAASFRIICDRGVSHEIVRHRLASYSQESTRYCNYSKDKFGSEIAVIQPPGLEGEALDAWKTSCQMAEHYYSRMLEKGCSPQIARSVLPTCLKTELVMTANFREWMHFIRLRTSKAAHPQIRPIAQEINRVLAGYCPTIFGATLEAPELVLSDEEREVIRTSLMYFSYNSDASRELTALQRQFAAIAEKLKKG
jgi:thymidylate synthase (FAD)